MNSNESGAIVGGGWVGVGNDRSDLVLGENVDLIEAREHWRFRIIDCDGKGAGFTVCGIERAGSRAGD